MINQDFMKHHLYLALLGAQAEVDGNEALSRYLHADTKLRLISMSDQDLWELANLTTSISKIPVKLAYKELKDRVEILISESQRGGDLGEKVNGCSE